MTETSRNLSSRSMDRHLLVTELAGAVWSLLRALLPSNATRAALKGELGELIAWRRCRPRGNHNGDRGGE